MHHGYAPPWGGGQVWCECVNNGGPAQCVCVGVGTFFDPGENPNFIALKNCAGHVRNGRKNLAVVTIAPIVSL